MTDYMAGQRVNVAAGRAALVRSPYPPISGDEGRSGDKRVVSRRGPK